MTYAKEKYLFDDFDDYIEPSKIRSEFPLELPKSNKGKRMMSDNAFLANNMTYSGLYNIPNVKSYTGEKPSRLIPYNIAHRERYHNCCIHFFIDDWNFECLWKGLYKFADILRPYKWVAAPDFSMYMDSAMTATNIKNVYENRFVTSYLQQEGVNMIPSISCGGPIHLAIEERLHPTELLIYGSRIELPGLHTPVTYYKEYTNTKFLNYGNQKER